MRMALTESRLHLMNEKIFTEGGSMFGPFRIRDSRNANVRNTPIWALLIGETYASAVHVPSHRRPHRGMLPDVDFSRALAQIGRRTERAVAGVRDDSMGERPSSPYVASDSVADSDGSEMPGSMRRLAA
jgi:hypothetical protein